MEEKPGGTFIATLECNILKHFLVNRVMEPFVGSKMATTLELKLCLSNFSRGIERPKGYQGTNITLIFIRPVDLFLIPYF